MYNEKFNFYHIRQKKCKKNVFQLDVKKKVLKNNSSSENA